MLTTALNRLLLSAILLLVLSQNALAGKSIWREFIDSQQLNTYFLTMHQDPQSFYWLGTMEGLFKFDGNKLQAIAFLNKKGINPKSNPSVIKITQGADGELWIGTTGGLYWYSPITHQAKQIKTIANFPVKRVFYHQGKLFGLSYEEGPFILDKQIKSSAHSAHDNGNPNNRFKQVLFDGDQHGRWIDLYFDQQYLWALDNTQQLWRINPSDSNQRVKIDLSHSPKTFTRMLGFNGALWLVNQSGQVFSLQKQNLSDTSVQPKLQLRLDTNVEKTTVHITSGQLFFIAANTIYRFDESKNKVVTFKQVSIDQSPTPIQLRAIFIDQAQQLWLIGQQQNQLLVLDKTISELTKEQAVAGLYPAPRALTVTKKHLYINSKQALYIHPINNLESNVPPLSFAHSGNLFMLNQTSDTQWFWQANKGIANHQSGETELNWFIHPSCFKWINNPVFVDRTSDNTTLVFDRQNGVIKLTPSGCQSMDEAVELPRQFEFKREIFDVAKLADDLWFVASQWASFRYNYKNNDFMIWNQKAFEGKPVFKLDSKANGDNLYLAVNGKKLAVYQRSTKQFQPQSFSFLPGQRILKTLEVSPNHYLVISNLGIYTIKDGIVNYLPLDGSQLSARQFAIAEEQLIFYFDEHIYKAPISKLQQLLPKMPQNYVRSYQVNHQTQHYTQATQRLTFSHSTVHLGFNIAVFATSPTIFEQQYRIEGIDQQWLNIPNDNWVHFTRLPAGQYQLQTRTFNPVNGQSTLGKTVSFQIKAHPLVSLPAIIGYLIASALLIWLFIQRRLSQLDKQKTMLSEQVAAKTAQLNSNIAELQALAGEKAALLKLKDTMLTAITHELKTPLTTIKTPLSLLNKALANNQALTELLNIASRGCNNIERFIEQILYLAKLSQSQQFNTERLAFDKIVKQTCEHYADIAKQYGVTIHCQITSKLMLQGNKKAVEIMVGNLLSNAIRHSDSHDIYLFLTAHEKQLSLSISALNTEQLKSINKQTLQIEHELLQHDNSIGGLGFYIINDIVNSHQGQLIVEQTIEDSAYIVTILIPFESEFSHTEQHQWSSDQKVTNAALTPPSPEQAEPYQLLIVEDHIELTQLLKKILHQYQLVTALNGEQALNIINNLPIDLVVSDHHMPKMSGTELIEKIKANPATSHIPVLMLSADTGADVQQNALEQLADVFLHKPIEPQVLLAQVKSLIENRAKISINASNQRLMLKTEKASEQDFVTKLNLLLEQNYADADFKLSDHLEQFDMSERNLRYKMHILTGESPSNYLYNYRIEKAKQLLQSDLSSEQIAKLTGFKNTRQFRTRFIDYMGLTPAQMREQLKSC